MNIKKFLIISCFALQISTMIEASYSQDNFNKAFTMFGGGTNLATSAANVKTNKGKSSVRGTSGGLSDLGKTNEATIVVNYLINKALSAADTTALNAAFDAAQATVTAAQSSDTPTPTPSAPAQLSDTNAANWTAAITAFGGSAGIAAKTASAMMPSSMTSTSAGYADAQVILQYLNGSSMNATDLANLTSALAANPTPVANATITNTQTTTPTPTATDTAAVALKTQIDSSLAVYNSYLTSVSQPQIKIVAAA